MGLEKEKLDTSIIMDEDEFNRSIEPILSKKAKVDSSAPDRDPHDINAQLEVKFAEELVHSDNSTASPEHELFPCTTSLDPLYFCFLVTL